MKKHLTAKSAFACFAVSVITTATPIPVLAAQPGDQYKNIIGAAGFCNGYDNYIVDWGGSWESWNVEGCQIGQGEGTLNLLIKQSSTGRRGLLSFELNGTNKFTGYYKTQTNANSKSFYSGTATLSFDKNGKAIGRWVASAGLWGGGSGPLEVRHKNSQRAAGMEGSGSSMSASDLLNLVSGIRQLSKELDATVQQGLISTLGPEGVKALATLSSSGASFSNTSENIADTEAARRKEEVERNNRFSAGWACVVANNCPTW